MKLNWTIEPKDIELVREVIEAQKDKPIVVNRFERNLQPNKPPVKVEEFWLRSVCCLVTSQQPSGEDSRVARFVNKTPFPLELDVCRQAENLRKLAEGIISSAGLRFNERIAGFIVRNLEYLENGGWQETTAVLDSLRETQTAEVEREKPLNSSTPISKGSAQSSHGICFNGWGWPSTRFRWTAGLRSG